MNCKLRNSSERKLSHCDDSREQSGSKQEDNFLSEYVTFLAGKINKFDFNRNPTPKLHNIQGLPLTRKQEMCNSSEVNSSLTAFKDYEVKKSKTKNNSVKINKTLKVCIERLPKCVIDNFLNGYNKSSVQNISSNSYSVDKNKFCIKPSFVYLKRLPIGAICNNNSQTISHEQPKSSEINTSTNRASQSSADENNVEDTFLLRNTDHYETAKCENEDSKKCVLQENHDCSSLSEKASDILCSKDNKLNNKLPLANEPKQLSNESDIVISENKTLFEENALVCKKNENSTHTEKKPEVDTLFVTNILHVLKDDNRIVKTFRRKESNEVREMSITSTSQDKMLLNVDEKITKTSRENSPMRVHNTSVVNILQDEINLEDNKTINSISRKRRLSNVGNETNSCKPLRPVSSRKSNSKYKTYPQKENPLLVENDNMIPNEISVKNNSNQVYSETNTLQVFKRPCLKNNFKDDKKNNENSTDYQHPYIYNNSLSRKTDATFKTSNGRRTLSQQGQINNLSKKSRNSDSLSRKFQFSNMRMKKQERCNLNKSQYKVTTNNIFNRYTNSCIRNQCSNTKKSSKVLTRNNLQILKATSYPKENAEVMLNHFQNVCNSKLKKLKNCIQRENSLSPGKGVVNKRKRGRPKRDRSLVTSTLTPSYHDSSLNKCGLDKVDPSVNNSNNFHSENLIQHTPTVLPSNSVLQRNDKALTRLRKRRYKRKQVIPPIETVQVLNLDITTQFKADDIYDPFFVTENNVKYQPEQYYTLIDTSERHFRHNTSTKNEQGRYIANRRRNTELETSNTNDYFQPLTLAAIAFQTFFGEKIVR